MRQGTSRSDRLYRPWAVARGTVLFLMGGEVQESVFYVSTCSCFEYVTGRGAGQGELQMQRVSGSSVLF